MANKLFTSKESSDIIDTVHDLLGLKNSYFIVTRLAISVGLNSYKMTGKFQYELSDTAGKEFNEYTLLSDTDGYKTTIRAILQLVFKDVVSNEDVFFGNKSIIKRLIDEGCNIMQKFLKDSFGDRDLFLKKLYAFKYDNVLQAQAIVSNTQGVAQNGAQQSINSNPDEMSYIELTMNGIKDFLEIYKYQVNDIGYALSSSVLRIKVKLPLGTKPISQIYSREGDLKLHLCINSDIIISTDSGFLCFDIQRKEREIVYLKNVINRIEYSSPVKFPLGLSVNNDVVGLDLTDSNTPHLLIAGSTGQGKSECIKCIIGTLINKNLSKDLKLILIDPKKVEFSRFKNVPHLYREIITEVEEAILALEDSVTEMDRRYDLLNLFEVNNIDKYNEISDEKIPHLVIIFDEFAGFILESKSAKERIESSIKKLAGKARASGIHLVLSTQRPDKDIITGVIKSNLPARIAFKTATASNSQIILDNPSASHLFGRGDMLLDKEGSLLRIQGCFIDDDDLKKIIDNAT